MWFIFLEINECKLNPCLNDGVCTDLLNDYECDCVPGYTGKNCGRGELMLYFIYNNFEHGKHSFVWNSDHVPGKWEC